MAHDVFSRQPIRLRSDYVEKDSKKILFFVFLTIFLDLVGFGMFIPIIPLLAKELAASDSLAVNLSTLFSIGTLLAVTFLGRASDKWGRKPLLLATIAISALAQGLTGFATQLPLLFALRFVAGMAAGNISVAQAAISDITPPEKRSGNMVFIGLAFGLGFAIGPALGAVLASLWPDSSIWPISVAAAALNLFNLAGIWLFLPETYVKKEKGDTQSPHPFSVSEGHSSVLSRTWLKDLKFVASQNQLWILFLVGFLQVAAFVGFESILSLLLSASFGFDKSKIYHVFIFIGVSLLVVNGGITRPFIKKFGDFNTLKVGQILLVLSFFTLGLTLPSEVYLYVSLIILTLGLGLANPSLNGSISNRISNEHQGLVLGLNQSMGALARILGPAFQSIWFAQLGSQGALFISGGVMLLGSALGLWFLKPPPQNS